MLMFKTKKKKKIYIYPITPQTGVSMPLDPYINFAVSLVFMALKKCVAVLQTHVLLCKTAGGAHLEAKAGRPPNYFTAVAGHFFFFFLLSSQLLVYN